MVSECSSGHHEGADHFRAMQNATGSHRSPAGRQGIGGTRQQHLGNVVGDNDQPDEDCRVGLSKNEERRNQQCRLLPSEAEDIAHEQPLPI